MPPQEQLFKTQCEFGRGDDNVRMHDAVEDGSTVDCDHVDSTVVVFDDLMVPGACHQVHCAQ